MTPTLSGREALASYAREALRGEAVLRGYRPNVTLLDQAAELLPTAHVVVVSAPWCPDCRREVPKFSRAFDHLPEAWTVESRGDDEETRETLGVRAIPTFIVFDRPGGSELGRIIESPRGGQGLEGDLLDIAEAAASAEDVEAA